MNMDRKSQDGAGPVPVPYVASGRDAERRRQFMLNLMAALRVLDDAGAIQAEVDRRLAVQLDADRVFYGAVGTDGWIDITTEFASGGTASIIGRYPLETFGRPSADTLRVGRTLVLADVAAAEALSPAERRACHAYGMDALVEVPRLKHGQLVAVLAVHQARPRNWKGSEIVLLEEVAERTWAVLERARAEAALRASEAEFRKLFETMGQGYALLEPIRDAEGRVADHRLLRVNPAFERLLGVAAGTAEGRGMRELVAGFDADIIATCDRVARTGRAEHGERWIAGLGHWFDLRTYPAGGARVMVLYEAIDKRKRAEEVLRASAQRQRFLLRLSDALRGAPGADAIGACGLRMLAAELGLERAYVSSHLTRDGRLGIGPEWSREGLAPLALALADGEVPDPEHLVGRGTVAVDDVDGDARIAEQEQRSLHAIGVGAFIAAAVRGAGNQLVGALVAATGAPHPWTPDDLRLVEAAVERIWTAIERARVEDALNEAAQRLQQQADTFNMTLSSINDFAYTFDLEGRFTYANRALLDLWGLQLEDAVGRNFAELGYPAAVAARLQGQIRQVIETGEPVRDETPYTSATGADGDYEYIFVPVLDARHRVTGVVGSTRDVTARRHEERAANLLAAIVEYSDDAMVRKDLNGIIQTWNAGAQRMFGYTAAEVIGKSVTILIPPDRADEEPDILARVRRGERIDHYETVRQRKDGSLLEVSLSVSPIRDAHGVVIAASKIARDITGRKRIESALRDSERRQGLLLLLSDAMREQVDEHGIGTVCVRMLTDCLRVDRCFIVRLSGSQDEAWPGPEYRRRGLPALFASDVLPRSRMPAGIGRVAAETLIAADITRDPEAVRADRGSIAPGVIAAFIAAPMCEGECAPTWALVVATAAPRAWTHAEVHLVEEAAERAWAFIERARAAEVLRESRTRLERAGRTKDEFLAMLGHELRNPLAPIATTLELMKLRAPATFATERGVIEGQVRYLTGLVDDLLDVARIASGKIELKLAQTTIADVAEAAVETAQAALEEHRQTVHVQVEPGLVVLGDHRRLVQVLVNLLVNAAKYSPPGRNIYLSGRAEAGVAVVGVRDEGQGIPASLLPHVFELFTRDAQPIDRSRGGLGLGLAIVHNLVTLHGGSVAAASDGAYKGSEFTLRLPLIAAAPRHAEPARPVRPKANSDGQHRIKVLIIDDYQLAADSLSLLLQEMGYHTRVARDGAEGLNAVKEFEPQVALIDIGLPVIDGYEVARAVRAMPGRERLPMIAVTGYGQASDRARVLAAGFNAHAIKPIDAAKIGELIETVMAAGDRDAAGAPS